MSHNTFFNKKILSMLIEKASGDRSIKKYAEDCGISYMQLRKLWLCAQENPPRKTLVKKLSDAALGGIDYDDFAFACGFDRSSEQNNQTNKDKYSVLFNKLEHLSAGQRKTAEDFIDFLLFRR